MMPTVDVLARIREAAERAEKATKGPWTDNPAGWAGSPSYHVVGDGWVVAACTTRLGEVAENDAAFIAAARADVPYLAEVARIAVEALIAIRKGKGEPGPVGLANNALRRAANVEG